MTQRARPRAITLRRVLVATGIVGLVAVAALVPVDADQRFDLWLALVTAAGTLGAVFIGATLALRQADRDRRRRQLDEAITDGLALLDQVCSTLRPFLVGARLGREVLARNESDAHVQAARQHLKTVEAPLRDDLNALLDFNRYRGHQINPEHVRRSLGDLAHGLYMATTSTSIFLSITPPGHVHPSVDGQLDAVYRLRRWTEGLRDAFRAIAGGKVPDKVNGAMSTEEMERTISVTATGDEEGG